MAFLTKNELHTVADLSLVDKITNLDDTIITEIIDESISLMTTYLASRYDTATIFSATGNLRHLTVLKYLKDIVIYEIYIRYTKTMNEVALMRKEEALKWLEKVNTGEFVADLPVVPIVNENAPVLINYGGSPRYSTKF